MPVEDGFALLSSSFQRYQQQRGHGGMERMDPAVEVSRTSSAPTTGRNGGGGNGLLGQQPEPHPSAMQMLIDQLQANRPMTALEYDRLVRYLSDRRDRQMMIEDQHQQQPQPGRGGAGLAGSQPSSYHHHGTFIHIPLTLLRASHSFLSLSLSLFFALLLLLLLRTNRWIRFRRKWPTAGG